MKTIEKITAVVAAALSLAACDGNDVGVQQEGREDGAVVASDSPTTTSGDLTTPTTNTAPSTESRTRPDPETIKVPETEITNPEDDTQ